MNQQTVVASPALPTEHDPARFTARIIWDIVSRNNNDTRRSLYLLDGIVWSILTAVCELGDAGVGPQPHRLAISSDIKGLDLARVDPRHIYDDAPVRVRNKWFEGPVLLAARESERSAARSSLGTVLVLDPPSILAEDDIWIDAFFDEGRRNRTDAVEAWARALLAGVIDAGLASDLLRFSAFVRSVAESNGSTPKTAFLNAVYHLRLPIGSVRNAPAPGDKGVSRAKFAKLLRDAKKEAGNAPMLFDRNDRKYDIPTIRQAIEDARSIHSSGPDAPTPEMLDAVEALIDDDTNIDAAEWRESQETFCRVFDWQHAPQILGNRKAAPAPKLHERIETLLKDEGREDAIARVEDALATLRSGRDRDAQASAAIIILDEIGEWLLVRDKKIVVALRKLTQTEVIVCNVDLPASLLQAYQRLMSSTSADLVEIEEAGHEWSVALTTQRKDKASMWRSLHSDVYETFLLEMRFAETAFEDLIEIDLGKWLVAPPKRGGTSKDPAVNLRLELRRTDEEKPLHIVHLDWAPKVSSFAVALARDIDQLYSSRTEEKPLRLWNASSISTSNSASEGVSLNEIDSFGHVGSDRGVTVAGPNSGGDFFERLEGSIEQGRGDTIDAEDADAALQALQALRDTLSTVVEALHQRNSRMFDLDLIDRATAAYGSLCRAVTPCAKTRVLRDEIVVPICEFGLLRLKDEQKAIVPGWHPIRLFERRAKLLRMATVAKAICEERGALAGRENEVEDLLRIALDHRLPEAIVVGGAPYHIVESKMGYGLAVSGADDRTHQTSVEGSAEMAAETFLSVVDNYLELNPHEEANLSTAIYGTQSTGLPRLLTDGIEDRMKRNRDLRCELFITHDRNEQLRDIYAVQNAALRERGSSGDGGFLARLRVGVLPTHDRGPRNGARADIDVVLLHDAYQGNSDVAWELANGSADMMPDEINLDDWFAPRVPQFTNGPGDVRRLSMRLSVSRPPKVVGYFSNLCYLAQGSNTQIRSDQHAHPVRTARWDADSNRIGEIGHIVSHAHELGEWVVSVDQMSTRAMLQSFGIEVIRDIPARNSNHRILVSASKPSVALHRHIADRFKGFHGLPLQGEATAKATDAIRTIIRAAGQKILGASRSPNAANEIIGLAAAVNLSEDGLTRAGSQRKPIWLSLDETKSILGGTGKIADAVAFDIDLSGDRPQLNILVVEAKCVEVAAVSEQMKGSREQTVSSLKALNGQIGHNDDMAEKRSRCSSILGLMAAKPEYGEALSSGADLRSFESAMLQGDVDVSLRGLSVVVAHDALDGQIPRKEIDFGEEAGSPALQVVMDQRELSNLLVDGKAPVDLTEHLQRTTLSPDESGVNHSAPEPGMPSPIADENGHASSDLVEEDSPDEPKEESVEPPAEVSAPVLEPLSAFPAAVANFLAEAAQRPQAREDAEAVVQEAEATARAIQDALTQYGMEAVFHDDPFTITPNGTLVRFKGHRTLTEKSIRLKLSELHTTHGVDVVYIRPGRGWLGLFVQAERRRTVHLPNLWMEANWRETAPRSNASILIGSREDDGRPLWLNMDADHDEQPQHGPHTLIAGETGSGKGNLLQSILLQLAATNDPRHMRIKLIDPKQGADFFWLEAVPHMDGDIVATPDDAVQTMKELVAEMDRRYELITGAKTRNIEAYNSKVSEDERLPRIVVAHDEMASWMQGNEDYRKAVEAALTDLASKSRAAGIHMVLVTQRASQEAIPPSVRENMNNRLCLKVASDKGSKLALGVSGAEDLLGRGHLAASLPGDAPSGSDFYIAQVPFISEDDLEILGELIRDSW